VKINKFSTKALKIQQKAEEEEEEEEKLQRSLPLPPNNANMIN
jgi:hypothetical protein